MPSPLSFFSLRSYQAPESLEQVTIDGASFSTQKVLYDWPNETIDKQEKQYQKPFEQKSAD